MPFDKRMVLAAAGAGLLAGCGGAARRGLAGRGGGERVVALTGEGVVAVEAPAGTVLLRAPSGVAGAGARQVFATRAAGAGTSLSVLDAAGGAVRRTLELPGRLSARVASVSGRLVALAAAGTGGPNPWTPAGRERTTLVVADVSGTAAPRAYELPGNVESEAFGADDARLFVVDHVPPLKPDRYRVRQLDLTSGRLGSLLTRNKVAPVAAEEEMRGQGRMQVLAPSRRVLYTLYTRQPDHLHGRDMVAAGGTGRPRAEVDAFVHVLHLAEQWAFCLDLPRPFGTHYGAAHALAVARDGRRLFVADVAAGAVAVADADRLTLERVATIELPKGVAGGHGEAAAAMTAGPDGTLYLAAGADVLVLSPSLAVTQRWTLPGRAKDLTLSPDGRRLYAALDGTIAVLDAATGRQTGALAVPGITGLAGVG